MSNPNTAEEMSETEIIKKNICDSCYDEGLHNLVNTPIEQVASAMREHTAQTLDRLKGELNSIITQLDEDFEVGEKYIDKGDFQALKEACSHLFISNREAKQIINQLIEEVSDE